MTAVDLSTCDDPSRYRYQRGCRCAGCVVAQAEYKAQEDGDELKQMLRRLLSLDRQPLDKSKGGDAP